MEFIRELELFRFSLAELTHSRWKLAISEARVHRRVIKCVRINERYNTGCPESLKRVKNA